jgi:hypothetical protein
MDATAQNKIVTAPCSESGPDVDAASNCHEIAVEFSPVGGIDKPNNKMPACVPGIGELEGWSAV